MDDRTVAVLRHLRTFPLRPSESPHVSSYIGGEYIDGPALRRLLETAHAQGLVVLTDGNYSLTDEGRAAARAGEGELTLDRARSLHARELVEVWGDVPLAREQLALRASGGARVRGALVASGEAHSGTGGWHVIPYVTPALEIGYVDTARGRAWLTGTHLEEDQVVALTAPGQGPGPKVPDAGRGSSTEAPDGWVQLVVDIRTHEPVEEMEAAPVIVAYGLVTCYSHQRGAPLGDRVSWWPLDDEQRARVQALAEEWLDTLIDGLGRVENPYAWERSRAASLITQAIGTYRSERSVLIEMVREHGISRVAEAAGEFGDDRCRGTRRIDAVYHALEARVVEALDPMVVAMPPGLLETGSWALHTRERIIVPAARAVIETLLLDQAPPLERVAHQAEVLLGQCTAILYERGAIVTDEGVEAGVTCRSAPARPVATRGEIDGREVWRVPFGAARPDGFDHALVLAVDHELVCREEDAEVLTRAVLLRR